MSIPQTQLGLIVSAYQRSLQTISVPVPEEDEILIRNVVVSSNPKDWWFPLSTPGYACVEGNDIAGFIVALGPEVDQNEFHVGDHVAALTRGFTGENRHGAFAEYTIAMEATTFPLGPHTSFEEAASLPLAVVSAALNLFCALWIPEPPAYGVAPPTGEAIIINGAGSSVGIYAVQFAKRAGMFVVGIAGASAEYARSLGVDVIVDYRNQNDLEGALIEAIGSHSCSMALDVIVKHNTPHTISRVLARTSPSGTGKVAIVGVWAQTSLVPGIEIELKPATAAFTTDEEFIYGFLRKVSRWLDEGSLRTTNIRVMPGGLCGIEQGLAEMQAGKTNGDKLVYRIADTPNLL